MIFYCDEKNTLGEVLGEVCVKRRGKCKVQSTITTNKPLHNALEFSESCKRKI